MRSIPSLLPKILHPNRPFSHPHHSAALTLPPSPPLHNLLFHEAGSLDDLETLLDGLAIPITTSLLSAAITSLTSPQTPASVLATRRFLRFLSWSRRRLDPLPDALLHRAVRAVAARKDSTALKILIADLKRENRHISADAETFAAVSESFVKSGREIEAVRLFKDIEDGNPDDRSGARVTSVIHALCEKGHARKAEGVLWHHKEKVREGDVYRHLLYGWCKSRNAGEARRVIGEMKAARVCPGIGGYNAYLRCVCDRNLRFNPAALVSEANVIMMEMTASGVLPTAVSYNILLSCLGRTRRVKEACETLEAMVKGGGTGTCFPDWVSYFLVVRVLYLTQRFVRGNRVVGEMVGSGVRPRARFWHDLVGVLCGVERMDHALQLFEGMKRWCGEEGDFGPTYDLLITKLCLNGEFVVGKRLWDEAVESGVALSCSVDLLDPSKVEVFEIRKRIDERNPNDIQQWKQRKKSVLNKMSKLKKKKKTFS